MVVRTALTTEQIALLASTGVNPAASAATTAPSVVTPAAAAPAGEGAGVAAPATTEAAAAAVTATPATAAVATPATEAAAAAAPAANTDVVTFLQTQVATKDAALLTANVEITGLKSKIADNEASITGLKAIAAASISNMRVALGGSKTDLTALTATELLAQHTAAKTEFEAKFVAGGVAAVDVANPRAAAVDANVSQAEAERLNRFLA